MVRRAPIDYGDGIWLDEFSDFSFRDPDTGRSIPYAEFVSDHIRYKTFCNKLRDVFCIHRAYHTGHTIQVACWPDIPESPLPFAFGGIIAEWNKEKPGWHFSQPYGNPLNLRRKLNIVHIENLSIVCGDRFPDDETILKAVSNNPLPASRCTDIIWKGHRDAIVVLTDGLPNRQELRYDAPFIHWLNTTFADSLKPYSIVMRGPGWDGRTVPNFNWPFGAPHTNHPTTQVHRVADESTLRPGSPLSFHVVTDPGSPQSQQAHISAAAGILVRKGQTRYLVSSTDLLYPRLTDDPKHPHRHAGMPPAPNQKWTPIGNCTGPVDSATIIPGIQLDSGIDFSNSLPELNTVAKRLLPTAQVNVGDEFFFVSSELGIQRMRLVGKRWTFDRDKDNDYALRGSRVLGRCICGDPYSYLATRIRDAALGAVVVRCRDVKNPALSQKEVLARGEVWGMTLPGLPFGWVEILPFDSLIEQGWSVDSGEVEGESLSNKGP
ncbi:hypothetical protein QBC34DRAFT_425407 [Podospora aff. communis PSN243]|uniref:Uncharacterized protein n=1 Tax=Podospora aff. communis PSN243 TaxID=3040156 RepID=A0AAV9GQC6_9PEZI|nr:hypothetical protein QBC34DRAFT_425407 [Podospora aff. communis PSN243]